MSASNSNRLNHSYLIIILTPLFACADGMSVFQIKAHKHYSSKDFDKDLRAVLIRAGAKQEKVRAHTKKSSLHPRALIRMARVVLACLLPRLPLFLTRATRWKARFSSA